MTLGEQLDRIEHNAVARHGWFSTERLTLVARLRNSHAERIRYHDIRDPGVQALEWLREYRRAREVLIEAVKWPTEYGHNLPLAEADMANAERNFISCRERMRAQGRFNRAMGEAA